MTTLAKKVVITITGSGWHIEVLQAAGLVIADRTGEMLADGVGLELSGDDLFEHLPVQLAATLDDMDLTLTDAVIALMPEAA